MKKPPQIPTRKTQTTWDLTHFFQGDDDPAIEKNRTTVEEKSYAFINQWKHRKDYLRDPAVLRKALDEYEVWKRRYGTDGTRDTISGCARRLTGIILNSRPNSIK